MFNEKFEKLFNRKPRKAESALSKDDMDMAASIQAVTEEIILKLANYVHKQTGMKNLCLAGGVALNCVSNGNILKNGPFENIWIQPAAGDAGGALGAALAIHYMHLNNERKINGKDFQFGSLLGPKYSDEEILKTLKSFDAKYTKYETEEEVVQIVAKYISEGKKCQIITEPMLLKMLEENPEIPNHGYIFKKGENVPERLQCSSCSAIIAHYNSWDIVPSEKQKEQLKILYDGFSGIGIWVKMFVNSSFCFCIKIPAAANIWIQIEKLEKCLQMILGSDFAEIKKHYYDINSDKGQELFNKFQRYK
jgi:hypothetical protein